MIEFVSIEESIRCIKRLDRKLSNIDPVKEFGFLPNTRFYIYVETDIPEVYKEIKLKCNYLTLVAQKRISTGNVPGRTHVLSILRPCFTKRFNSIFNMLKRRIRASFKVEEKRYLEEAGILIIPRGIA